MPFELKDPAVKSAEVDFAFAVGSERGDLLDRHRAKFLHRHTLLAVAAQAPHRSRNEVGVEVHAFEFRQFRSAVDAPARDAPAVGVRVFDDRFDEVGARSGAVRAEGMLAFANAPAVVAAAHDDVDFLPELLADVADPYFTGRLVEAHPPWVANAVGPNLSAGAFAIDERVVGGSPVF